MRIPACLFILIAMTAHCLAAETFESLEQIVAPAGRPSGWKAGGKWNVVLVEEASARVQKAALKQTARIKL